MIPVLINLYMQLGDHAKYIICKYCIVVCINIQRFQCVDEHHSVRCGKEDVCEYFELIKLILSFKQCDICILLYCYRKVYIYVV